jgi:hypothetical protein
MMQKFSSVMQCLTPITSTSVCVKDYETTW